MAGSNKGFGDEDKNGFGISWEGMEAAEERAQEREEHKLRFKMGTADVPEGELPEGFEEGTWIDTPKGRRICVGVPEGELSPELARRMGESADMMIDQFEKMEQEDPDLGNRIEWMNAVVAAVKSYVMGDDRETLWKLVMILIDYEKAAEAAKEKGYTSAQWEIKDLIALLPPCERTE
jgi:hypothetical protein